MMKNFTLFFFGLLAFSVAEKSQVCISTSLEYTVMMGNTRVLTYTSNIHTKEIQGSSMTQFFVTDETFTSANMKLYRPNTDGLYVSVGDKNYARCNNIGGYCSWLVGNETVELGLSLALADYQGMADVTENIIDENGINLSSGEFFTKENNCQSMMKISYPFDGYVFNVRQCCKDFKPVPPPAAEHPKCMAFNSSVSYYNNTILFASVNATINVTATGLNISSSSFGPIQGSYSISQNMGSGFCGGKFGHNATCTAPLPKSNFKVIFPVVARQSIGNKWQYTANAGRLISRNSIYQKEEGIAFTQSFPCLQQSQLYNDKKIYASSNFCCTAFDEK